MRAFALCRLCLAFGTIGGIDVTAPSTSSSISVETGLAKLLPTTMVALLPRVEGEAVFRLSPVLELEVPAVAMPADGGSKFLD